MKRATRIWLLAASAALLTGCAGVSMDEQRATVSRLAEGRTGGVAITATQLASSQGTQTDQRVTALLAAPLGADAAVEIALLNNPALQASLAGLQMAAAERVQAGTLPNPHFAFGRLVEGNLVEWERALGFNLFAVLTMPWRIQWQDGQLALAQLRTAQDVVRLAADTRKAWVQAVAAEQVARQTQTAMEAMQAAAELARRMTRVGNWSTYQQAREELALAEATAQLARARQAAFAARENLTRQMGLWGEQIGYTLPERLPDLPKAPEAATDIESMALRERLDVRAARDEAQFVADNLGFVKVTGVISGLDLGLVYNTNIDNAAGAQDIKKGWGLELPIPLFDWGGARNARAQGQYLQAVARVRDVAVRARSEVREAWHGYRTAWDLARQYRDTMVPLRKRMNDEVVLRYNGMLMSAWDLLADTRQQALTVARAIEAERDFWLADTDLKTALSGTSPGAMAQFKAAAGGAGAEPRGH
ncbi:MAG: TolC family protein [Burkholderiaceae bacterium]|nr:TolC family protein [Burkholderiaceae bacterium]